MTWSYVVLFFGCLSLLSSTSFARPFLADYSVSCDFTFQASPEYSPTTEKVTFNYSQQDGNINIFQVIVLGDFSINVIATAKPKFDLGVKDLDSSKPLLESSYSDIKIEKFTGDIKIHHLVKGSTLAYSCKFSNSMVIQ